MFKILLTLLFSFYTTISFSHSQLTDILPKNNIVYTKTPSKIELTFRSKVKLIKIYLNKTSGENSKIKIDLKNIQRDQKILNYRCLILHQVNIIYFGEL